MTVTVSWSREMLDKTHSPLDWKKVMSKTADMMLNMSGGAKLFDEDFQNISCPVSINLGSEDKMVSFEESSHVAHLLPNCTFTVHQGIEHPIEKVDSGLIIKMITAQISG